MTTLYYVGIWKIFESKTIWEKYGFIVPLAGTTTVLFKEKFQFHF